MREDAIVTARKAKNSGAILRWFFFTVFLSLLQLWVLVAFRFFREEALSIRQVLVDGGLIFYANSVAMDVLAKRWDEFKIIVRERGGVEFDRDGMFLYGMLLPSFVLVVAVVMYCALLSKDSKAASTRILWGQVALTTLSLIASLAHGLQVHKRFGMAASAENIPLGSSQRPNVEGGS